MAWMTETPDFDEARANARRALNLPLGMTSPLWLAFGAAASAGVAWWWMTRWARPLNIEAELEAADQALDDSEEAEVAELAAEAPAVHDDLSRLTGIGPKLSAALAERGVTRFAQIAAWTDAEAAALDADMKLMGRIARDAWIAQARRLASA